MDLEGSTLQHVRLAPEAENSLHYLTHWVKADACWRAEIISIRHRSAICSPPA